MKTCMMSAETHSNVHKIVDEYLLYTWMFSREDTDDISR